ncbi:uncharacterized protein DS421_16g564560 [Arachis hypogaea]|nr:uncharacterized protein DS421_16g564560 [Arachis hypogaea]
MKHSYMRNGSRSSIYRETLNGTLNVADYRSGKLSPACRPPAPVLLQIPRKGAKTLLACQDSEATRPHRVETESHHSLNSKNRRSLRTFSQWPLLLFPHSKFVYAM